MTTLLVVCRRCAAEHNSIEDGDGLCLGCQADDACGEDRAWMVRLKQRRDRYARKGGNVQNVDIQAARVQRRMIDRLRRLCAARSSTNRVQELFERQGQAIKRAVDGPIVRPS